MKKFFIITALFAVTLTACQPLEAEEPPTTTTPAITTTTVAPTTTTTTSTTTTTTLPPTTTTIPEPEGCHVGGTKYFDVGYVGENSVTNEATESTLTETICVQLASWSEEDYGLMSGTLIYTVYLVVDRNDEGDVVRKFTIAFAHMESKTPIVGVYGPSHPVYGPSPGSGSRIVLRNVPAYNLVEEWLEVGEYYIVELWIGSIPSFADVEGTYYRILDGSRAYNIALLEALESDTEVPEPEAGAGSHVDFVVLNYNDADWPPPGG